MLDAMLPILLNLTFPKDYNWLKIKAAYIIFPTVRVEHEKSCSRRIWKMTEDIKSNKSYKNQTEKKGPGVLEAEINVGLKNLSDII